MKSGSQEDRWIFGHPPNGEAELRLFCFPSAGGGASMYYPWINALAPGIEVYPVQLPGRENRLMEHPFERFDELISVLAQALLPHFAKPFAFFGHSMGALICFGLTRHLLQRGEAVPVHLFLSAYRAPHIPNAEALHQLTDVALIRKVIEMNGTQRNVFENPELRQLLLPIFRADFGVCETYLHAPGEPPNIPITAFGGWQDQRVSQVVLEAWREQTRNAFALHMLPGDHFFWRSHPQPVWQIISQSLAVQCSGVSSIGVN